MQRTHWIAALSAPLLIWACSVTPSAAPDPSWEAIFDGESLAGWTPKIVGQAAGSDTTQIFRVEDGAITVSYEAYDQFDGAFGHLFFADDLSDYRLRFEYKFFGDQAEGGPGWAFMNSGVMVHAQAPETMQQDQAFPVSVEAQLLGKRSTEASRTTANICTPGTHIEMDGDLVTDHCIGSDTQAGIVGEWVRFEIEVRGGETMRLLIAGEDAFVLNRPTYDSSDGDVAQLGASGSVTHGHFALQAESHPVAFRNIELMRLEPAE